MEEKNDDFMIHVHSFVYVYEGMVEIRINDNSWFLYKYIVLVDYCEFVSKSSIGYRGNCCSFVK